MCDLIDWTTASIPTPSSIMSEGPSGRQFPRRITKRKGTTRERTGCLTCRQRKKRCDLGYPVCTQCVRLNYKCKWEEPRPLVQESTHSTKEVSNQTVNIPFRLSQVPDPILFWVDDHSDNTSRSSRRHFLRYYAQTFTHMLTTNIENNSFLSVFLPMAMQDSALLNALIAWSSSHLSLRDPAFQQVAMQNRLTAMRDLRLSLESSPENAESNLAITLVLCSMESIMADNDKAWYLHLMGAAGIISSRVCIESGFDGTSSSKLLQSFDDAHTGRWLLRNFAYHDILMAVALDREPLLPSHYFVQLDEGPLADSYFGLASEILTILYSITALNKKVKSLNADLLHSDTSSNITSHKTRSSSMSEIASTFSSLELRLREWVCPPSNDESLILFTESYRSSALLYLYRVVRRGLPGLEEGLSPKTAHEVATVVANINKMPTRSLPECTLLFPLFLAGGEASEESHIKSIRHKMLDMIESRGFRNVEVALSVLEKLWRLNLERKATRATKGPVDWLDIVLQDGVLLSLS
ncbi:unnamed protein product [Penicillium salamii]|uniref:Zn(2)-C6 fungal-type domain-containing protein n=1 Tax=Penicillium salamii TaxID=1612424 RepID=A0A9W4IAU7_9EURO|nr:unnamed protein product [Penicillium salamii]CAG8107909.1 unnamed protein product [Penicillium salamii]CAG8253339.1 unnamed protein product [Penicillium salamii]CAG8266079.1 unnamed protein product [Penicillium salamii]CAG8266169.1 unnamed protein product [Penicillium salamii]